jgi:hypothetical protein
MLDSLSQWSILVWLLHVEIQFEFCQADPLSATCQVTKQFDGLDTLSFVLISEDWCSRTIRGALSVSRNAPDEYNEEAVLFRNIGLHAPLNGHATDSFTSTSSEILRRHAVGIRPDQRGGLRPAL